MRIVDEILFLDEQVGSCGKAGRLVSVEVVADDDVASLVSEGVAARRGSRVKRSLSKGHTPVAQNPLMMLDGVIAFKYAVQLSSAT